MPLTKIEAENFTVFKDITIPFGKGLNVLVGENGVGKTHIMKLAYAACKASKHDVSFSQKTTMLFRPDQSGIGRLVNRGKSGSNKAMVSVESDTAKIGMTFSTKTRKWDAEIQAEENWEKQMSDLTSVFIPAKEILSNAWNLDAAVKMGNVEFDDMPKIALQKANRKLVEGVQPYDRKAAKTFSMGYLSGFQAERRDLEKEAFGAEIARDTEQYAKRVLENDMRGYTTVRPVHQQVGNRQERWRYALVPVWVMTYKGKNGKIYYYTINGQNGKVCGELPVDYKKLSLISALITGVVFLLGLAGGWLL